MGWATDFRQTWIAQRLTERGYIQRSEMVEELKVNAVTASTDIQRFLRERQGAMVYDKSTRRYIRAAQ